MNVQPTENGRVAQTAEQTPGVAGRIVACTIGFAPAALFILTWTEDFTVLQNLMRAYGLPIVAAELAIIAIALREGVGPPRLPLAATAALTALILLAWITAFHAPFPVPSIIRTGIWSVHLLLGFAVAGLAARRVIDPRTFASALMAGFLLVAAMLLVFVATRYRADIVWPLSLPAFSNIRWFGYFAAAAIGLAAFGFTDRRRFPLIVATVGFAMAFWTGSRGAVVAAFGGLAVAALANPRLRSRAAWVRILAVATVGLIAGAMLDSIFPIGQGPQRMLLTDSSLRVELWIDIIENIRNRPVFGFGEAQVEFYSGRKFLVVQAHNVVLQVIHAWGLVGAALLAPLAFLLARRIRSEASDPTLPFFCTAAILSVFALYDGTLFHTHAVSLFVISAALAAMRSNAGPGPGEAAARPR